MDKTTAVRVALAALVGLVLRAGAARWAGIGWGAILAGIVLATAGDFFLQLFLGRTFRAVLARETIAYLGLAFGVWQLGGNVPLFAAANAVVYVIAYGLLRWAAGGSLRRVMAMVVEDEPAAASVPPAVSYSPDAPLRAHGSDEVVLEEEPVAKSAE